MKNTFRLCTVAAALSCIFSANAIDESKLKTLDVAQSLALLEKQINLKANYSANVQSDGISQSVKVRAWDGEKRTKSVATVLIEFSDVPHNSIKPAISGHYFEDYSPAHFQQVVYSENGYTGPNGKQLMSKRQYILDQSGHSFDIQGSVFGWYKAKHDHKYYGAGDESRGIRDINPQALVVEAVQQLLGDPTFKLADYDADGDGNIDHLSVIHSTLGGETQSDMFGDYIWSHSGAVSQRVTNPETGLSAGVGRYIIQPIDSASGVLAHEFGHDLGLPDEYDTKYSRDEFSTPGSTIGNWSMMAGGSWLGDISGTEPAGFSPFAKLFLQNLYGGNWVQSTELDADSLTATGTTVKLHQAATKGQYNDMVKVNLPTQTVQLFTPLSEAAVKLGSNGLSYTKVEAPINFSATQDPTLSLDVNMSEPLDSGWGFLVSVFDLATGQSIPLTPIANESFKSTNELVQGTDSSWQTVNYDLSNVSHIQSGVLVFQNYALTAQRGYVAFDNVSLTDKTNPLLEFTAGSGAFELATEASLSDGKIKFDPYYLLEWRQHAGVDAALKGVEYEEGLLVWYVDPSYMTNSTFLPFVDNATGQHPGEGWLTVVDADRNPFLITESLYDANGQWIFDYRNTPGQSMWQVKDAPFNTVPQTGSELELRSNFADGSFAILRANDAFTSPNPRFIDWDDYSNHIRPATGAKLPAHGLIFEVVGQTDDQTVADIKISKVW